MSAPVAYIRFRSDGGFEGPIAAGDMGNIRLSSGAWTALYPQSELDRLTAENAELKAALQDFEADEACEQRCQRLESENAELRRRVPADGWVMGLSEAISEARRASHQQQGKCAMCAVGDIPHQGMHKGAFRCGNEDTCLLCHDAGMEHGDQCASCGRIEMRRKGGSDG